MREVLFDLQPNPIGLDCYHHPMYDDYVDTVESIAEIMYFTNCISYLEKPSWVNGIFNSAMKDLHEQLANGKEFDKNLVALIERLHKKKQMYEERFIEQSAERKRNGGAV